MKEITIRLTDKEYDEYRIRMKKDMLEEEYVKWMFMLGEVRETNTRQMNTAIYLL